MMFKAFLFAVLAVVVLADEVQVPDDALKVAQDKLREACKQSGHEDKYQDVTNAGKAFIDCVKGLIDVNVLKTEIAEAKPNGALDEVFQKYCAKAPQFKTCLHTVIDATVPCLPTEVQSHITTAKTGANELIDFICYKDGDRIALFIAEQGPECFQERSTEIRECGNTLKNSFPNIEAAKALSLNEKCQKIDELSTCVVTSLEKCSTPTPANMAESLFRYVRKSSSCKDVPKV